VLGGMRWKSGDKEVGTVDDDVINSDVSKGLHDFLRQLFPTFDVQVEHEWSGIMGFSSDRRPLVGPIPDMENAFMIAGFTGHGMPFIFGCGQSLAEMISAEKHGYESKTPSNNFPECLLPSRLHKA